MRREHLYLHDIREACDLIQAFLEGLDAAAFLASELHKAATLQKLTVSCTKHLLRLCHYGNGACKEASRCSLRPRNISVPYHLTEKEVRHGQSFDSG